MVLLDLCRQQGLASDALLRAAGQCVTPRPADSSSTSISSINWKRHSLSVSPTASLISLSVGFADTSVRTLKALHRTRSRSTRRRLFRSRTANPAEAPPPPAPDPAPPDISSAGPALSDEQLLDIFQRPLYDIYRAWRAPLFRIIRRLSQGILEGTPVAEERCTLAFLLLPGLVAECHYGKWIPVAALLSHLEGGVDRACSDEDYGALVLAQAQEVVPRVQAYRDRAADRRSTQVLDHTAVAALQRNIDRLLRQRRLGAANRLLDKLQATLQSGAVSSELALTLEEVRAQVAKLFPPAGARDTFSEAQLHQAQATAPLSLPPGYISTILPTLNRGSGSGVSGWTNAVILDVFAGDVATRGTGADLLTDLCNKMLAGQMRSPLWLLSRLVLIPKPLESSAPGPSPPLRHFRR